VVWVPKGNSHATNHEGLNNFGDLQPLLDCFVAMFGGIKVKQLVCESCSKHGVVTNQL